MLSTTITPPKESDQPTNIQTFITSQPAVEPSKKPTAAPSNVPTVKVIVEAESWDDFITVMLAISSLVLCCIVVFCITAKFIMNKDKEKCQNTHHDQSAVNMLEIYKIKHIQQSNIVQLDDSGCLNDNNMAIVNGKTLDDTNKALEMQNGEIRLWLESISFPEYFNNFVSNGYESFEFIKEIRNESELLEIGITNKSECNEILGEIEKLRMIAINQTKDVVDELKIADGNEGEPGNAQIADETLFAESPQKSVLETKR